MNGVEFGWASGRDDEWCARRVGVVSRMLCGREVGHIPAVQPEVTPPELHDVCRHLIEASHLTPVGLDLVVYGTCPVCVGDVPVEGGVVAPHGRWAFRGAQGRVTNIPCDGAGQKPEVES